MPSTGEPARKRSTARRRILTATTQELIKGKIAAVIPPYDVAINAGRTRGVQEGDVAIVYFEVDIDDPDTADRLGTVRYVRGRFRVTLLTDAYCVATMNEYDPATSAGAVNTAMFLGPRLKRVVERSGSRADEGRTGTGVVAVAPGDPVYFERAPASEGAE